MLNTPIRAAVIGCGRIGSGQDLTSPKLGIYSHCEAYYVNLNTELLAVCDEDETTLKRTQERWNVPYTYSSIDALLESSPPEIISVCVPDAAHYSCARKAILCPTTKCVIVEKPLARSIADAVELISLAQKHNTTLLVNYTRRFCKSHQQLSDLIRSGELGKIVSISGVYTKGILHNGTHWFDLLHFFGEEIQTLQGLRDVDNFQGDRTISVLFRTKSGADGFLQGFPMDVCTVFEMEVRCRKGRVRILDSGAEFEWWKTTESKDYAGHRIYQRTDGIDGGLKDSIVMLIENGIASIKNGEPPLCSGMDALKAMKVAFAANQSLSDNQPTTIGEQN